MGLPHLRPLIRTATRMDEVEVVIALGANLGDVRQHFQRAIQAMGHLACSPIEVSGVYRSAPWHADGPDYFNTVCIFSTQLNAPELLKALLQIEKDEGRERPYLNAPRTLDLDLIFYGASCLESPELTIPHPRWALRGFVVQPLAELRPGRVSEEVLVQSHDPSLTRLGGWQEWCQRSE